MKTIPWLALALILGLVLGGWGPRADLQQARAEITRLQEEKRQQARPRPELGALAAFVPVPGANAQPAGANAPAMRSPRPRAATEEGRAVGRRWGGPPPAARPQQDGPERFREQIRQAAELWRTRAEVARNTFIANAIETDDQEVFFDAAIETMNVRLTESIQRWADALKQEQTLTPEIGVRMMNDLSGTLVQTYDELDQGLPEGWRDTAGGNFQLIDLIDPEVAMPLAEVQDVLARRGAGVGDAADTDGAAATRTHRITLGVGGHDHSTLRR